MSNSVNSNMITIYFKVPFTEITHTCQVQNSLTIRELLEYVNSNVRYSLYIDRAYDIDLVESGQTHQELANPIVRRNNETLLQRYGSVNKYIAFYARPMTIIREYIIREDYSV
jgi:hypothetical protein